MARFTADMGRAAQQTEQAMGKMNAAVNFAKGAIVALGVAAAGMKLVNEVRSVIEYADHLNDLSKSSGLAIEQLDGLALAAKQSGADLDSAADAINKLSVNIGKAPEKYRALGITAKEPMEAFKQLADIFVKIEDPQKRAAVAAEALGKAWKGSAPLLAEGSKAIDEMVKKGHELSGVTKETAEMADKFNDAMAEIESAQKGLARELAADLLPALSKIATEMANAYREGGKLQALRMGFRQAGGIMFGGELETDTDKLVKLNAQVRQLYDNRRLNNEIANTPAGKLRDMSAANAALDAEIESKRAEAKALEQKIVADGKPPPAAPTDSKANAKVNAFLGGTADAKALLDGRLKKIENALAIERDAIAFHAQYMQEERNQDLISLDAYNAGKVKTINDGLAAALTAYDKEIAELEKARAAAIEKPERAQLANQIEEKRSAKIRARVEAGQALQMNTLSLSAAQSDLNKTMKEWDIQQDQSNSQLEFSNSLYGKSALEVAKMTEAKRLELDIENKIREAQKNGAITADSIAKYRKDAKDQAAKMNPALTQANGNQIRDSLATPDESENKMYANRIADLQAFQALSLQNYADGNALIERENMRHQEAMVSVRMQADMQTVQLAGSSASQLYNVMQQAGMQQTALGKALFVANKAIAVAEIIMNTEVAAAKALTMGPLIGPPLATAIRVMGYASAGIVIGTTIASAEGGYDIPAGTNPVTQLHEKEMVLPKEQADVIRGLSSRGGAGGTTINHSPVFHIDSRADRAQAMQEMKAIAKQSNADLVDRLQRAGRI